MLSDTQLATVRAALHFWQDEICPFGDAVAEPYFDLPVKKHLSASEVQELQRRFADAAMRYVPYNRSTERIVAPLLFKDRRIAQRLVRDGISVGTVLLE